MKKYLFLDAAFEGSRMLPGAVSTAYMMSKGVSIGEVATLKMVQSSIGFFCELPTGLAADHLGRRLSLLLATGLGAASFAVYAVSDTFPHFLAAEALLALCLCFWSGAFEAYALEGSSAPLPESEVHRFFHSNSGFNSLGTIIGGSIGAALASVAGFLPFAICSGLMMLLFGALLLRYPNDNKHESISLGEIGRAMQKAVQPATFRTLFAPSHRPYYAVLAAAQFVVQPLFYYWQPWFQPWAEGTGQWKLGLVFTAIQLSLLGAGILGRYLSGRKSLAPARVQRAAWFIFGASIAAMSFTTSFEASLLLLVFAEFGLGLGLAGAKGNLNHIMTPSNRASVLSAANLIGRFAGMVSLSSVVGLSSVMSMKGHELPNIFMAMGFATLFLLVLESVLVHFRTVAALSRKVEYVAQASNQ